MCCRLNDSNFFYKYLIRVKYHYILSSLTSNSPFTWPTTSLESENIVADFLPILWTIDIHSSNASYSASLFVAEKPSLNDFQRWVFQLRLRLALHQTLSNLLPHPHTPSTAIVLMQQLGQLIFHPCDVRLIHFLQGSRRIQRSNLRGSGLWLRYVACI